MKKYLFAVLLLCLTFSAVAQPEIWPETTITDQLPGALAVTAIDIEHDGDYDIFAVAYSAGEVWWFENTGVGWEQHLVADSLSTPIYLAAGDLDGDNDEDLVSISFLGETVHWHEYSPLGWTTHELDASFGQGRRVMIDDVDDDGDNDVIGSSQTDGFVFWRNNGGGDFTRSTISGSPVTAYGLDLVDMDDDGDLDAFGCDYGDGTVYWYENTGGSWSANTIHSGNANPQEVSAADIDNDFDIDVVVSYDQTNTIVWIENLGGDDWSLHTITSDFTDPNDVVAVDIDNDSDPDVIASSYNGGMVTLWENDGGTWVQNNLSEDYLNAWSVSIADMDGDNDLDVVSSSYWAGIISFWSQPGIGFPVSLSMQTNWWPIEIPAEGGVFLYGFRLLNATGTMFTGAHYWNQAVFPDGTLTGVFNVTNAVITPFMDVLVWNIVQEVPANVPEGQYTYIARIGYQQAYAEGNFVFTKLGAEGSRTASADDWDMGPINLATGNTESEALQPDRFTMHPAAPNPFNAMSTLSVTLSTATNLRLELFNVTGQRVDILADGQYQLGTHSFSVDASNLSSGVYFLCASVPNQAQQVQKLMLLQ